MSNIMNSCGKLYDHICNWSNILKPIIFLLNIRYAGLLASADDINE